MTTEPPRERVVVPALLATSLAAIGVLGSMIRPSAPAPAPEGGTSPVATFDAAVLDAVAAYRGPRVTVSLVVLATSVAIPVLVASVPAIRRRVLARVPAGSAGNVAPWRAGVVAGAIVGTTALVTLPAVAWSGLVHDQRWGFRAASTAGWLRDWALDTGGRVLVAMLAVAALYAAVRRWPRSWPSRATVAVGLVAVALVALHPVVVQPLFVTTEPMPPGPLRDRVAAVAEAAGSPDVPIVVADASRRTTRVNALVTGLGPTERIVLFDTLLTLPVEQVVTVVAHELAHRQHRDLLRGAALAATFALPVVWCVAALLRSDRLRRRTGALAPHDGRSVLALVAFALVVEIALTPFAAAVSRRAEAAADHGALQLGADPETLLRTTRTFVVRDLADPAPPAWRHRWFGTHPTVTERITAATSAAERTGSTVPSLSELRADEVEVRHPRTLGR